MRSNRSRVNGRLQLTKHRYGEHVTWDTTRQNIHIDLQAVVVSIKGIILDAVYGNNPDSLNRAIGHTSTGKHDQAIWVNMAKLPEQVKLVIFVIAASGGHLRDVCNGEIGIIEEYNGNSFAQLHVENSRGDVDAVVMFRKSNKGIWTVHEIQEFAEEGGHFLDILEPTLGDIIRNNIPDAPRQQQVSFNMEQGSVIDIPHTNEQAPTRFSVALGWEISDGVSHAIDLDVSAVFYHEEGRDLGAVYYDNIEEWGIKHSGDCQGEDDEHHGLADEAIQVNLKEVPAEVAQIFFIVNIYSDEGTFDNLENGYCIVRHQEQKTELATFLLGHGTAAKGLIIARLLRVGKRWGFQALGVHCSGQTWMGSTPAMKRVFQRSPQEFLDMDKNAVYSPTDRPSLMLPPPCVSWTKPEKHAKKNTIEIDELPLLLDQQQMRRSRTAEGDDPMEQRTQSMRAAGKGLVIRRKGETVQSTNSMERNRISVVPMRSLPEKLSWAQRPEETASLEVSECQNMDAATILEELRALQLAAQKSPSGPLATLFGMFRSEPETKRIIVSL